MCIRVMLLAISKNVFEISRYKQDSSANYFKKAKLQDNEKHIHSNN